MTRRAVRTPLARTASRVMGTVARLWVRERAGRVQQLAEGGDRGRGLCFLTGFDRSGTTWLTRMVAAHPECVCRTGGHFFNFSVPGLKYLGNRSAHQEMVESVLATDWWANHGSQWMEESTLRSGFRDLVATAMRSFAAAEGAALVADKSVTQDGALIRSLFPDAPVVAMVRDGRDACVSYGFAKLRKGHDWKFQDDARTRLDPTYVTDHAAAWSAYNDSLRDFADGDPLCRVIRYEDLLPDTPAVMADLFAFLGVAADPETVARTVEAASFERLSGGRSRGQEDAGSFFRKGVAGDWVERFGAEDAHAYGAIAGDVLRRFGYTEDPAS